jgi:hypothetical protein
VIRLVLRVLGLVKQPLLIAPMEKIPSNKRWDFIGTLQSWTTKCSLHCRTVTSVPLTFLNL